MQQLDKKAVWLFFLGYFSKLFAVLLVSAVLSASMLIELFASPTGEMELGLGGYSSLPGLLVFICLVVGILAYVWARLTHHYYRYELGELVFKKEHGVIYKKYVSIPYDRIQNVDIHRGILARLLGLSDLQIQTAGGITMSSYGAFSEGRLIGLPKEEAERLRDEVIRRARNFRNGQGL